MRAVVQRVAEAEVRVADRCVGRIARGFLVLVGAGQGDGPDDAVALADKIVHLRVFDDDAGKMNRALSDVGGAVLAVSQFTLFGDCRKGRRPAFSDALEAGPARVLFDIFVEAVRAHGVATETGQFGAHMAVRLVNDGPVTLLLDSRKLF